MQYIRDDLGELISWPLYNSLKINMKKKKILLASRGTENKENEQDDMQHGAQQPSAPGHQGSQELEQI